jgi:hypothetical protein
MLTHKPRSVGTRRCVGVSVLLYMPSDRMYVLRTCNTVLANGLSEATTCVFSASIRVSSAGVVTVFAEFVGTQPWC